MKFVILSLCSVIALASGVVAYATCGPAQPTSGGGCVENIIGHADGCHQETYVQGFCHNTSTGNCHATPTPEPVLICTQKISPEGHPYCETSVPTPPTNFNVTIATDDAGSCKG